MLNNLANAGVEVVKFQTFNLDDMTMNINKREFLIKNNFKNKTWNSRSLYSIYKEAHLPFGWHKKIFKKAKSSIVSRKSKKKNGQILAGATLV